MSSKVEHPEGRQLSWRGGVFRTLTSYFTSLSRPILAVLCPRTALWWTASIRPMRMQLQKDSSTADCRKPTFSSHFFQKSLQDPRKKKQKFYQKASGRESTSRSELRVREILFKIFQRLTQNLEAQPTK